MTAKQQVAELKAAFSDIETISFKMAAKLGKLLDDAPLEALILLVQGKVNFCSAVAMNRLRFEHDFTWDEITALENAS